MNFVKQNNTKRREGNQQGRRSQQPSRGRGQQLVSTLDPRLFEKKAKPLNEARYESPRKMAMGWSSALIGNCGITDIGWE